jgi:hypothetical protein
LTSSPVHRHGWLGRNGGLLVGMSIFVAAALVANVQPAAIELAMRAIGLGYLGNGLAALLMHLTEGLVVLLLLAVYVERWPFRQLEQRLSRLESRLDHRLMEVDEHMSEQLVALHIDHLQAQEARRTLTELLEDRCSGRLGNMMDLVLPEQVGPVLNATIEIHLRSFGDPEFAGDDDRYYMHHTSRFTSRESEYIIALVNSKGHLDRLYDANAPIHEILVLPDFDTIDELPVQQIVEAYDIRLQSLDQRSSTFRDARVEKIEHTTTIWHPRTAQDLFPLVLLRLTFDDESAAVERSLRLTYQTQQTTKEGFCFWTASWPTYVETITVNANQLRGVQGFRFERFLPNFDRTSTFDVVADGIYTVTVENWILKGHGVILAWQSEQS